jgi:ribosomal protein S18 acetylase RimI-like enzyme
MALRITLDTQGVDWEEVCNVIHLAPLWAPEPDKFRKACARSAAVAFAYEGDRLIGVGRAISDGEYCAYLCDVAVLPEFQGQGVGTKIVQSLLERLPVGTITLFAAPGKEGFYERFSFRRMKTAMAKFADPQRMRERGIIE